MTAELGSLLGQLQAKVSPRNRATLQVMAEDGQPSRVLSSKIKPLVGFLGVGLVLTFIIPQAVEGVAARRRVRKRGSAAIEPEAAADVEREPTAKMAQAARDTAASNSSRHSPEERRGGDPA